MEYFAMEMMRKLLILRKAVRGEQYSPKSLAQQNKWNRIPRIAGSLFMSSPRLRRCFAGFS